MSNKERATYVYRLKVEYPEGIDEERPPANWELGLDLTHWKEDGGSFRWPRKRRCLSLDTAQRWATRLMRYGCTVKIERSKPVEWDDGEDD